MALKSDLVPHDPMPWPVLHTNMTLALNRHRGEKVDFPEPGIAVPWMVTTTILDVADESDPTNQLRMFCVRVGKSLAYRIVITEAQEANFGERDMTRLVMSAILMLGVEHGAEIRDAIAAERAAAR